MSLPRHTIRVSLASKGFPRTAAYLGAIYKEAKAISRRYHVSEDFEDVLQVMLAEATRLEASFDATKGNTFFTYIKMPLRHVIQKVFGFSKSAALQYNKIYKFMKSFEVANGYLPTTRVIAEGLDMTTTKVKEIFYGKPLQVSLDALSEDVATTELLKDSNSSVELILEALSEEDQKLAIAYYVEEFTVTAIASIRGERVRDTLEALKGMLRRLQEAHNVR